MTLFGIMACKIQSRLWVKLRRTQYEHMFSALPPNSDIARCSRHVSKVPTAEIPEQRSSLTQRAKVTRLFHSITASAVAIKVSGTAKPSAFAVLRLLQDQKPWEVRRA